MKSDCYVCGGSGDVINSLRITPATITPPTKPCDECEGIGKLETTARSYCVECDYIYQDELVEVCNLCKEKTETIHLYEGKILEHL